jgi:hypothetical protein
MEWRQEISTGIVNFIGMEIRDGHKYCGAYWDGNTRWAYVFWSLLEWRHEMCIGIMEFLGWRHEMGTGIF